MNQEEKLMARLRGLQKDKRKPILVSMMILVGEDGDPAYWWIDEYKRAEG